MHFRWLLAHGVGGRSDLPLPAWLFSYGAGSALLISFVTLHIFWRRPQLEELSRGETAWRWVQHLRTPVAVLMRVGGLVGFSLVVSAAWLGDKSAAANIAPVLVYVIFWVGLQIGSFIFGDVWSRFSPWETLALFRKALVDGHASRSFQPVDGDHRLAALGIAGFVWLELCYHDPSSPRVLGVALGIYSIAMVVEVARHGSDRLATSDPFAAWFAMISSMAPLFRDSSGHIRLRWPFTGLAIMRPRRGSLILVMVVLGSTAFDGMSRTRWWRDWVGASSGWESTRISTIGLLATIGLMYSIYASSMYMAGRIGSQDRRVLQAAFMSSLIPIALAYAIGHYFSLLLFEGQQSFALLSDPLGRGWDLFGTIDWSINYNLISTGAIAWVQVSAIVIGHIAGVAVAHDRALSMFSPSTATESQIPLLGVMVAYTVGGLALLLGA